jgi:hypothetical protein
MFYTPGPKALREYEVFTHRRHFEHDAVAAEISRRAPMQTSLDFSEGENAIIGELTRRGVTAGKARELLARRSSGEEIIDQIEYVDSLVNNAPKGKFHNPSGFYVKFIQDNAPVPESFLSSRKQRLLEQAKQASDSENARIARLQVAFDDYQKATVEEYLNGLAEGEYKLMFSDTRQRLKRSYSGMTDEQLTALTASCIRNDLLDSGQVKTISFKEFCNQRS